MHDYRTHTCGALRLADAGQSVRLSGWVRWFVHGGGELLNLRRVSSETELTNLPLMSVIKREELSVEQCQQQLQRVLQSNTLRNSPTLQQLLQFLGTRGIEGAPEGLKEYTIGVEAFGRKPDFDPKTDTAGPLSIGVAATKKEGDKTARLVVIGDSDFATNQELE